ncbi:HAMP domain-containing sensor histidine kinase [Longispora fulva]|uniref:Signal transduction histidine-protein kinase/phosphatase MprB n=1 Tax=Longispora fulva TaxID=619741 RepID=A0A8J7KIU4_9ACTN|nr:HAMP domain-containing sensor histidine kinase [Longispora fulva]MBG6134736.1 signal transduction histidine kinase [Longispora fulva]
MLLVLVPLLVGLFAALGVPLAAYIAQRETQAVYLDRLADADRFASVADDALRRGRTEALTAELRRYADLYGIDVGLFSVDGRLLGSSGTAPRTDSPAVADGLATALAGYRPDRVDAVWPWRDAPMVVVEPVGRDSGVIAAVVLVSPTGDLRSTILRRWGLLFALGLVPLALVVAAAVPLARWVLRPVRELDSATIAIAAGRLDARAATLTGPPELRRLAGSFNTMAGTVARILRQQRTFVADASHQLRNPLASLRLAVEVLGPHVTPAGREAHADAVAEAGELERVVEALLALTEVEGAAPLVAPQPLADVFAAHVRRWTPQVEAAGMRLVTQIRPGLATHAPPDGLGNVLDELVANAARLSGGTLLRIGAVLDADRVVLTVRDDGGGLTAEERSRAAGRFWRGASHHNLPGTGLGLAICTELVAAWGGELSLHALEPQGLEVRIALPGEKLPDH